MSRGVTLLAVGGYGYLEWAVNQAVSIRYHSPDLPIQLIVSNDLRSYAEQAGQSMGIFDYITELADTDYKTDGRLFPAKIKTALYRHLLFDNTIYLDVDGCTIAALEPLFDFKSNFVTDVQAIYSPVMGPEFEQMKWAKPAEFYKHFGLKELDRIPAINSSFMLIRKCDQIEKVFEKAHELLISHPMPESMRWYPWGKKRSSKINEPDELYFNAAFAVLGFMPDHKCAVHFRMDHESGPIVPIDDLAKSYYGIGLFGEMRSNHIALKEHYNKHMRQCWNEIVWPKTGAPFSAKAEILGNSKFVLQ